MSEKLDILPETKKKTGILSPKVRKFLEAFSLSIGLITGGNAYAGDINNYTDNPGKYQARGGEQGRVFNELKYAFIEKNNGLIGAIGEKLKDEGKFEKQIVADLDKIEESIILLFTQAIEKEGLDLSYPLDTDRLSSFSSIKYGLKILMNSRYGKGYCDIFDGKDHSKSRLRIIFKETDKGYIIEKLYIIRGEGEKNNKSSTIRFLNQA